MQTQAGSGTLTLPAVRLSIPKADFVGLDMGHDELQADRRYPAAMLRPGIYTPGLGNPGSDRPARVRFRGEIIERLAATMEGKKVNLEHKQDMDSEVGFVDKVHTDDDQALRGTINLQAKRTAFTSAVAFVEGRIEADQVPNVSVEILRPVFAAGEPGDDWDLDLIDGEFDGVSILPTGACSDKDGCGIGLTAIGGKTQPEAETRARAALAAAGHERVSLAAFFDGVTGPAGEADHVHSFTLMRFTDDESGKPFNVLFTDEHFSAANPAVSHSHEFGDKGQTSEELGHAHLLPPIPGSLFAGASITVLALQERDAHTEDNNMGNETQTPSGSCKCGGGGGDLQANLAKARDDLTAAEAKVKELEAQVATQGESLEAAEAQVRAYEAAEKQANVESLQAHLPEGADLKNVLGCAVEEADLKTVRLALRAVEATGARKGAEGGGRRTVEADRANAGDAQQPNAAYLGALRKRMGLKETPAMPAVFDREDPLVKEAQ